MAKAKQKEYANKHRRATGRQYKAGDTVLLHQNKTTAKRPYDQDPFTFTHTQGTKITATRRGKEVTRNVDKWKILKGQAPLLLQHQLQKNRSRRTDRQ